MYLPIFFSSLMGFTLFTSACLADDSANSVEKTEALLKDPTTRQGLLDTQGAKNADAQIDLITKNKRQKDEIYNLTSDLLPNVATDGNADSQKMNDILMKAMQNPEAFYNTWAPQQKAELQKIVHEIEGSKSSGLSQP